MLRKNFMLHRLIWKLQTGEDPGAIDHINGSRADNRWENLRECPDGQGNNMQNFRAAHKDSRTGLLGVSIDPRPGRRYYARITSKGKNYNLGTYATAEEAHQVYLSAKKHLHEFGNLDGNPALVATAYQKMPRRQNKTGVAGVWPRYNGRFQAKIRVDGKTIHLGTFRTVEEASAAYQEARNRYRPRLALNGDDPQ